MKILFLLRHAEALSGTNDLNRYLSVAGKESALIVGNFMRSNDKTPELVICSHSERTKQTLELVLKSFTNQPQIVLTPDLYKANLDDLYLLLQQIVDTIGSVMLVGRNPTLSEFCFSLSEDNSANIEKLIPISTGLQPASLVEFSLAINSWQDIMPHKGQVHTIFTP